MNDMDEWLRAERDRREIEEAIKRYFLAFDRGDLSLLDTVFAPDGRLWVEGRVVRGPGAEPPGAQPAGISSAPIGFNHTLGQAVITVEGDTAHSEANATAWVLEEGPPRRILVRGLRYLDRWVRTAEGWRLRDRRHNLDWMFEADAVLGVPTGERLQLAGLPPLD